MNDKSKHEDLPPVAYTTFQTPSKDGNRALTGIVAVYSDDTGVWAKFTINGIVRTYERIAAPEEAGIR